MILVETLKHIFCTMIKLRVWILPEGAMKRMIESGEEEDCSSMPYPCSVGKSDTRISFS